MVKDKKGRIKTVEASSPIARPGLTFRPLTPSRWSDFEHLFGERGACGGCWCMSWRLERAEFESGKGAGNKKAMKKLVDEKEQIGMVAYLGGKPVGWCAVAPREEYIKLEKSRVLKRIDSEPVWSITCFFFAKEHRRKGYSVEMLKGVIDYCTRKGAKIIEAYPIIPYSSSMPAAFAWTGILSSFLRAGFKKEKQWSKARPIVRYYCGENQLTHFIHGN